MAGRTWVRPRAWLAASLVCIPGEESERRQGSAATLPVPVIGHWTTVTDSGAPYLVVNGAAWDGTADTADLARWSRELFGTVSEPFVSNGAGSRSYPLAVVREVSSFGDGTVRVGFRLDGGASDQIAGIVFGLQPSGDYYFARYNTREGNVAVWRYVNGRRETLERGAGHHQIPLGTWQELVVSIRGTEVRAHVAGIDALHVTQTLPEAPRGRLGLWVKRDAITAFRSFVVEPAPN